jgi:hypothetical protein
LYILGKKLLSHHRLNELKELYSAVTEERSAASTMHLKRQLEQYPSFQNYFGKYQDAGDTLARLMDAIASEEDPDESLSDLMLIRVIKKIVHSCHSETLNTTQEWCVHIHEAFLIGREVHLATLISRGGCPTHQILEWGCPACHTERSAVVSYRIDTLPLNRAVIVVRHREKLAQPVSFPFELL